MTTSASLKSDDFTACRATLPDAGSRDSECEPQTASQAEKHLREDLSPDAHQLSPALSFTSGTGNGRLPCSTECVTPGPQFSIRSNGSIGQEICDGDGVTIAWTTDPWVAQVICKLLNENERLLG